MDELERLKIALKKSESAVYEWNLDTGVISWTGSVADILSLAPKDTISNDKEFLSKVTDDDRERFLTHHESAVTHENDYVSEYKMITHNGHTVIVKDQGTVILSGKNKLKIGRIEPIKRQDLEESIHDEFSDYSWFLIRLKEAIEEARKSEKSGAMMRLSIDNLSTIMSWYDSALADQVIHDLETRIERLLHPSDVITRISINEFALIINNKSEEDLSILVGKIHQAVHQYTNDSFKESIGLKCSSGSVMIPKDASSAEEAMNKSYLAIDCSQNRTGSIHTDYIEAKKEQLLTKEQVVMINYLQKAMDEDRLKLAFQPIVETQTGKVVSHECLLRIQDENGKISSAGKLIPIAEKMGFIDTIDQYVLEHVVEEVRNYPEVHLGFNVSNVTTDSTRWLKMCNRLLHDSELASRIVVEITETSAQRDLRQTAYFVASLQALGCKVALDDFGAGYTSFRQLKSLSVDMVKIDGTYIIDLAENSENLLFIKTLLDFNNSYGLQTIAECVENGEVAKILMDIKMNFMQGYYFGQPVVERPWLDLKKN